MRTRPSLWVVLGPLCLILACDGSSGGSAPADVLTSRADVDVIGGGAPDTGRVGADGTSTPGADATADGNVAADVDGGAAACGDGVCTSDEDCTTCPSDCPFCAPPAGALVITEVMTNPQAVQDSVGEWVEIHNTSDAPVQLDGLILRDAGSDFHVIEPADGLKLPPGAYAVLGVSADLGVGLVADYVISNFQLSNDVDEVILEAGGVTLDAVSYDEATFPDPNGASLSLHTEATTAEDNDLAESWCPGVTPFGDGDLGTPGAANPPCAVCGDGECDDFEGCEGCPDDCGACTPCDEGGNPTTESCNGIDDDCDGDVDETICEDGLGCTTDWCVPGEGCMSEPAPGGCAVDGLCVSQGALNPANACEVCDEDESNSDWTPLSLAHCDDGTTCTTDDMCVAGTCLGTDIKDTYEHNDSQMVATQLGSVEDGDDYPAGSVGATLYGPGDEDWYAFHDADTIWGAIYPRADLSSVPEGVSYSVCVFMVCDDGSSADILSCEAGEEGSGPGGLEGCCSNESAKLEINCPGASDDGTIYVRVTHDGGPWTCQPYTMTWGDD